MGHDVKRTEMTTEQGICMDVESLDAVVKEVVKIFPLKIEEYQNGKAGIVNMLMGEIKSRVGDKFQPRIANELLMRKLRSDVNR